MDHIKKLVYTIVGCLTIVSLTFTICTKIGHCAESSQNSITYNPLPLYFGSGIGYSNSVSDSVINSIVDHCITNCPNYVSGTPVVVTPYADGNNIILSVIVINTNMLPGVVSDYFATNLFKFNYTYCELFNTDGSFRRSYANGQLDCRLSEIREQINGNWVYKQGVLAVYPIYIYNYENLFNSNGEQLFAEYNTSSPSLGHTKGGVLGNYIDSEDIIEDSSEVKKVDKTPPTDSSSIPGWLQKILNGLGVINGSIQSGALTIGDYIGQFKELVENAIAWITESPDSDTILDNVEPYLAENDLISGFLSSKTAIQGVYGSIGNVTAKTRSQMVWDIPFNLPSMSQTFHARIDFGWYENIRSTLEPFLNMFLCVTFLFSFLRSIPGILHGNSGEGDT